MKGPILIVPVLEATEKVNFAYSEVGRQKEPDNSHDTNHFAKSLSRRHREDNSMRGRLQEQEIADVDSAPVQANLATGYALRIAPVERGLS